MADMCSSNNEDMFEWFWNEWTVSSSTEACFYPTDGRLYVFSREGGWWVCWYDNYPYTESATSFQYSSAEEALNARVLPNDLTMKELIYTLTKLDIEMK